MLLFLRVKYVCGSLWWVDNLRIFKQSVVRAPKDAVLKLIFPWHLPSSTEEKLTEKIMLKKKEKL